MLATYYTLSKDSAPTPEEMRQKSREYMLMKPKKYSYSENRNTQGGSQPQRSSWYKPRDDMDKRRSCANCGSADHHVADCTTYLQGEECEMSGWFEEILSLEREGGLECESG